MNQGELIQTVRVHARQLQVLEEMIHTLQTKLDEIEEVIASPIRREIYATRQKRKQEGHHGEHSP